MAVARTKLATTNGSQIDASRIRLGSAGELAVASELMLRGWGVYNQMIPDNSDPFDIIATKGGKLIRIQVKTTGQLQCGGRMPKYVVNCRKRSGNGGYTKLTKKDCDFLVAYIYERGWVLVVPVRYVRPTLGVFFRADGEPVGKWIKFIDAWHLLDK